MVQNLSCIDIDFDFGSLLQYVNCERFIISCTVVFREMCQKQALQALRGIKVYMPFIQARARVTPCIVCEEVRKN